MERIKRLFEIARDHAAEVFPISACIRPVFCDLAAVEHARSWRQFSHTGHRTGRVCWAAAAKRELTDEEILGISAHELGHVIATELGLPGHLGGRNDAEAEANHLVLVWMDLPIRYNLRTLEEIPIEAFR